MHSSKRELLQAVGLTLPEHISLVPVTADLSESASKWRSELFRLDFIPDQPTLWIMEGFTGYLEKDELHALLTSVTELSAMGSRVVATWIGCGGSFNLHRTQSDEPDVEFMRPQGWRAMREPLTISNLVHEYNLDASTDVYTGKKYSLTVHEKR